MTGACVGALDDDTLMAVDAIGNGTTDAALAPQLEVSGWPQCHVHRCACVRKAVNLQASAIY